MLLLNYLQKYALLIITHQHKSSYICIIYIINAYAYNICITYMEHGQKTHAIYLKAQMFISLQKLYQCEIKLQTEVQITQEHET